MRGGVPTAARVRAGYSTNAINVWRYPGLQRVATLSGHTQRVLYLATSPDGRSIVTGAGAPALPVGVPALAPPFAIAPARPVPPGALVRPPRCVHLFQAAPCWAPARSSARSGRASARWQGLDSQRCGAGAGDETIRFWSVFPALRAAAPGAGLPLSSRALIR